LLLFRREFLKALAASVALLRRSFGWNPQLTRAFPMSQTTSTKKAFDVAVIGAGVFGAWTAYTLQRSGKNVVLLDAYGPSNSRASSGGESRIIRMGYGPDEIYTRWAMRSLPLWKELFERAGQPLFHQTGVLWISREREQYALDTLATLQKLGATHEKLSNGELLKRYPQIAFDNDAWAILEPASGVLMARRAVQAVVQEAVRSGTEYRTAAVETPARQGPRD
jgi:sarcosine oxidase